MLQPDEAVRWLARVPIFSPLTAEQLERLAAHLTVRRYRKEMLIFLEGEPAEALFFVIDGYVRVYQSLSDDREYTLEILGPNAVLAAVCYFDGGPYPASAQAVTDVRLGSLPYAALSSLLREWPEVALGFLRLLSHRLRRAHARSTELAVRSVHERLAASLLRLAEEAGRASGGGVRIAIGSRSDLAHLIGAARETTTRALSDMQRQGAIRLERGAIRIVDPERLRSWLQPPLPDLPRPE